MYNIETIVQSATALQRVASRVVKDAAGTPLATLGPNGKKCETFLQKKKFFQAKICWEFKKI